jgi:hypothetical protein
VQRASSTCSSQWSEGSARRARSEFCGAPRDRASQGTPPAGRTINRPWLDCAAGETGSLRDLQERVNDLGGCEFAASGLTPNAAEAGQFLVLLREVLAGRRLHLQLEYACHWPTQPRWLMVRVSRIEASEPPRPVVAHEEVPALKLVQEELPMAATTDEPTAVAHRRRFMQALGAEF